MADSELRLVSAVSLVDQVATEIRRAIVHGTAGPGLVGIKTLAKQLGVSHIPVREALRRLEAEGLVVIEPSRGAVIRPLRSEDIRAIYRLRLRIEPFLAALGCQHLTNGDFDNLEILLQVYRETQRDLDFELAQHRELHFTLFRPAATEWDMRVIDYLWSANERYARLLFDPANVAAQRHLEEHHRVLIDAARTGQPERIERAVEGHLRDNQAELINRLETTKEVPKPKRRRQKLVTAGP